MCCHVSENEFLNVNATGKCVPADKICHSVQNISPAQNCQPGGVLTYANILYPNSKKVQSHEQNQTVRQVTTVHKQ